MKLIYNQKENYIEHIKKEYDHLKSEFQEMYKQDLTDKFNEIISDRINKVNYILENGIDTGGLIQNMEKVIDIAFDSEKCNEGVEYAYHGENYYFVVKRGKKNLLFDANLYLSRM